MTDLSQWDSAGSFDQHEASCLVSGLDPAAVTREEVRVRPISKHIEEAYSRAFNFVMMEIDPPPAEDEEADHLLTDVGQSEMDRLFSTDLEALLSGGDGSVMRKWYNQGHNDPALQRFSRRALVKWITANSVRSEYAFVARAVEQAGQGDHCLVFDKPTELLKKLHAAHAKFWGLYDPCDRSTAPTNDQVAEWLTRQGVSMRTAEVMATMIRLDNLPVGRRS